MGRSILADLEESFDFGSIISKYYARNCIGSRYKECKKDAAC